MTTSSRTPELENLARHVRTLAYDSNRELLVDFLERTLREERPEVKALVEAAEELNRNWPEWAKDESSWGRFREALSDYRKAVKT